MSMAEAKGAPHRPKLALMFLSGGEMGKLLPLPPGQELIVGRGKTAQILVEDEKASRKHARIFSKGGRFFLEDLKSSNGTYVNGAEITRAELKDGDHVRIGKFNFKVVSGVSISPEAQAWWDEHEEASRRNISANRPQMAGSLKSVGLVDLLQLFVNSLKSGTLLIRSQCDTGRIYLRDGQIISASLNERTSPQPHKTVYRLLCWKEGTFELWPLPDEPFANEITEPTSSLLLDGVQNADELAEFAAEMPPMNARLTLARPLPQALHDLTPEELDAVQYAHESDSVLELLDRFPGSDVEAWRLLLPLLRRKLLMIAP